MIGSRLRDPHNVDPERLDQLQVKITNVMSRMCRMPQSGGNPFLYAWSGGKEHELANNVGNDPITTAATNGKKYFWCADFLDKLTPAEATIVMQHEGYHVVFDHPKRGAGKVAKIWNWAVDYTANGCIWSDWIKTQHKDTPFGGNHLGEPLAFKTLLEYIDGDVELPEGVVMCFADIELHGRSPESIYDEIIDHWNKSPRKCPLCGALSLDAKGQPQEGPPCGCGGSCSHCGSPFDPLSGMDNHIQSEMSKQEVQSELMRAAATAAQMRGNVPAEIEGMLGELMQPIVTAQDLFRNALNRRKQDAGNNNDWKRIRRRFLEATDPSQYLPKRYDYSPRWLAMLDTSGSMSDLDLAYCVSQLIAAAGAETEGYIVCCDATPHWDSLHKVTKKEDLQRVKVVGRGGTVFNEFLTEFPKKIGKDWDVLIMLTDGDCGEIGPELRPPRNIDVIWMLSKTNPLFNPAFGRMGPMRTERM